MASDGSGYAKIDSHSIDLRLFQSKFCFGISMCTHVLYRVQVHVVKCQNATYEPSNYKTTHNSGESRSRGPCNRANFVQNNREQSRRTHRGPESVTWRNWGLNSIKTMPTQISRFMEPTWNPPGSCRPQMGPMLAPWTLLSGDVQFLSGFRLSALSDIGLYDTFWEYYNNYGQPPGKDACRSGATFTNMDWL